jgi:hypothetical protein
VPSLGGVRPAAGARRGGKHPGAHNMLRMKHLRSP